MKKGKLSSFEESPTLHCPVRDCIPSLSSFASVEPLTDNGGCGCDSLQTIQRVGPVLSCLNPSCCGLANEALQSARVLPGRGVYCAQRREKHGLWPRSGLALASLSSSQKCVSCGGRISISLECGADALFSKKARFDRVGPSAQRLDTKNLQ